MLFRSAGAVADVVLGDAVGDRLGLGEAGLVVGDAELTLDGALGQVDGGAAAGPLSRVGGVPVVPVAGYGKFYSYKDDINAEGWLEHDWWPSTDLYNLKVLDVDRT